MLSIHVNPNHPWNQLFDQERERLLAILGKITEGGIVEAIEHIGSTSVPGLSRAPCVDIGVSVWPFPLEPARLAALEALGYQPVVRSYRGEHRFHHTTEPVQLLVVEAGSEFWLDTLILREFLRHDEEARASWAASRPTGSDALGPEGQAIRAQFFQQILEHAHSRWVKYHGFSPVETVQQELSAFDRPWWVAGGWALDLFLGTVARVHHDIDIIIPRSAQLTLQQFLTERGWKLIAPFAGRMEPWPPHMRLELPRHQVHAHRAGVFLDFLLTDIEHGVWRYRREPSIVRAEERMGMKTNNGISYVAPELVLLFKSKNTSNKDRKKDQADFERVYPYLEPERKAWLRWALIATQPDHAWLETLI